MPVEVLVGGRRVEDLSPSERLELGKRIGDATQKAIQGWVNENYHWLAEEARAKVKAKGA